LTEFRIDLTLPATESFHCVIDRFVDIAEANGLFQSWLVLMDDAIDAFKMTMPEPIRVQLNGSPASLDVLEGWLLSRYSTIAESKKAAESKYGTLPFYEVCWWAPAEICSQRT
jgi:hypothetical protein